MSILSRLLAVSLILGGITWGCGLAFARLLLPRRLAPLLPIVAPFLGFALISAVAHWSGLIGIRLRGTAWPLAGVAGIGWVAALLERRWRMSRHTLMVMALCAGAFTLATVPLVRLGYLTTLGATIDGVGYAARAEYLQENTLRPPDFIPGHPWLTYVQNQIDLHRAGDTYYIALLNIIAGTRSFELLSIVPAMFFALMAGAVYAMARLGLCLRHSAALLAAGFAAVQALLLWPVFDNFLSQMIALAFLPLVLGIGTLAARSQPDFRLAVIWAALFSALVSAYPLYAGVCLLQLAVTWCLLPRMQRPNALRALRWWVTTVLLTLLINGPAVLRAVRETARLSGILHHRLVDLLGTGNILAFPPWIAVFGLIPEPVAAAGLRWRLVPAWLLTAAGLACIAVAAYGWWRLPRPAARVALAWLLPVVAVLAEERFRSHYPYGYFKILTILIEITLALLAVGAVGLLGKQASARSAARHRWLAALAFAVAGGVLAVNLKHSLWEESWASHNNLLLDHDLIQVAEAASIASPIDWILVDIAPGPRQNWLAYLLRDHRIAFRQPTPFYPYSDPVGDNAAYRYAIVEPSLAPQRHGADHIEPWLDRRCYVIRSSNQRYELRQLAPEEPTQGVRGGASR